MGKYLYAARDKSTGKLVCDITSPGKRYWQRKDSCLEAINKHNRDRGHYHYARHGELELVTFELVAVRGDG